MVSSHKPSIDCAPGVIALSFAIIGQTILALLREALESPSDELNEASRERLRQALGEMLDLLQSVHTLESAQAALLGAGPGPQATIVATTLLTEPSPAVSVQEARRELDDLHAAHVLACTAAAIENDLPLISAPAPRDRVLFAVIDPEMRATMLDLLAERFDVDIVGDVETALKRIRERRPDLILLGVHFRRRDGGELLRKLGEDSALKDLPVIMLSENKSDNLRLSTLQPGVTGYMIQAASVGELARRASAAAETMRADQEAHESERRMASRLSALATASLAFQRVEQLPQLLELITRTAAGLISAHEAVSFVVSHPNWEESLRSVWLSEKYQAYRGFDARSIGAGIHALICETNTPMRLSQAELEAHPRFHEFSGYAGEHPPMRGWLAAPLIARDGRNLGLIQLSDKLEGDFVAEDELVLVQLAQIAASAIETSDLLDHLQHTASELAAVAAAKEMMLGLVSHELRTPLTTLRGNASALRRYGALIESPERETALVDIEHDAERLAGIVDNMLALARLDAGLNAECEPMLLRRVMESAIADFGRYTGTAVELRVPEELAPVLGHEEYVQQVLINLLTNAVKYGGNTGPIEVELVCGDGNATVTVADRGPGMTPDVIARLWDPFFRADDQADKAGIGLGLPVCKRLMEAQGGRIWGRSREGGGSIFGFELPLAGSF